MFLPNFLATPYVFNGFFMADFWEDFSTVILFILFVEINTIGIKKFPLYLRLNLLLYTLIYGFLYFVHQNRIEYVVIFAWVLVSSILQIKFYFQRHLKKYAEIKEVNRMDLTYLSFVLYLIFPVLDLQMLDQNQPYLWGLFIGVAITGCTLIILKVSHFSFRENATFVGIIAWMFPLIVSLLVPGLNYALDFSQPVESTYVITDLRIHYGAKSITTYEVYFELDDEIISVGVSKEDYYQFHIGDDIDILRYQGFFHYPYLLYEN